MLYRSFPAVIRALKKIDVGLEDLQEVGVGKTFVKSVHEKNSTLETSQRRTRKTEEMAHRKFQNEVSVTPEEEDLAHRHDGDQE